MEETYESDGLPDVVDETNLIVSENILPVAETKSVNGKKMPVEMADDFDKARNTFHSLIDEGMEAIREMAVIAEDSEHPRTYEVLSGMMKNMTDMSKQLVELNVTKHKITQELDNADTVVEPAPGAVIENAIFVGSTAELQKFFKEKK